MTKPIEERSLPPSAEGLDTENTNDIPFLRIACSDYGIQWEYSTDTKNCIKVQ